MTKFQVSIPNMAKDQTKPTKAYTDVTVAGLITLKGVRIMKGEKGFYLSMSAKPRTHWDDAKKAWVPSVNPETNQPLYDDHYFPVSKEVRAEMTSAVLAAYNAKVESDKAMKASSEQPKA